MSNNLKQAKKDLKAFAKRAKNVKYTESLLFSYLITGMVTFSIGINTSSDVLYERMNKELVMSADKTRTAIKKKKKENEEAIEDLNLELIQLMEQGDQVIKSKWASWQFGANTFVSSSNGAYKGRGDKAEKYIFNGIYTRSDWRVRNAMALSADRRTNWNPLTPGNESTALWKNIDASQDSSVIALDRAINVSTNGSRAWGLVGLREIKEPVNEIELLARISPKEVAKQPITLNVSEPVIANLNAPNVNPEVNKPIDAPVIKLPEINKVTIQALKIDSPTAPGAVSIPTINIGITPPNSPTAPNVEVEVSEPTAPGTPKINIPITPPKIKALNIETPPAVNVRAPSVEPPTPVAFSVAPTIDSNKHKIRENNNDTSFKDENGNSINNMNKKLIDISDLLVEANTNSNRNYITISGSIYNSTLDSSGAVTNPVVLPKTKTIDISVNNNRALVIDETNPNFEFHSKGTINLYGSQNMGIDLQGTHTGSRTSPAITTIINEGTINGHARNKYYNNVATKEQIAFGFTNADASNNTTMTRMINNNEITLNAPSSAGMQLKPEDPYYWNPDWKTLSPDNKMIIRGLSENPNSKLKHNPLEFGRVLMKAENKKNINLNGSGSFGIITVFNPGVIELDTISVDRTKYSKENYNLRAQREIKDGNNKGGTVLPGGEIGRSALTDSKYISGVYNSGEINIFGDESVGVGILHEIQEVKVGGTINIGYLSVVSEIKGLKFENQGINANVGTNDITKVESAVGVFAGVPTLPVKNGEQDTMGNTNNTGKTVGTETTEVNGTINIGEHATNSIGLLVGDSEENLNKGKLNGSIVQNRILKRSGSITLKKPSAVILPINMAGAISEESTINVDGISNYGFVVKSDSNKSVFDSAVTDNLLQSIDKNNYGIGINEGNINVKGLESIGFVFLKGGNSKNTGNIIVKENSIFPEITNINDLSKQFEQNSVGFYGEQDEFSNEGTIAVSTPNRTRNKSVLLKGNSNGITFNNKGDISVNGRNNIAVYGEGKYIFNHEKNTSGTNKISVGSDAIGIYAKDSTGTMNIKALVELANSSSGTTIGFYSDGNAKINFGDGSKLSIGKGAIGLFSSNTSSFKNTFKFNNTTGNDLEVSLDENSAFAFFNGSGNTDIGEVLNKNIKFTAMKKGATFGYAKGGSAITLDHDFDTTNVSKVATPESGTSVLVASDGSTVQVSANKTLTTNTNVGLVATNGTSMNKSKAINSGTVISKVNGGVGLYANDNSEATNETTGKITMENKGSAAILGEKNSDLKNKNLIELKEEESAGIYAKDSDATNSVTSGSPAVKAKISLEKTKSAGIYSVLTNLADGDKKILNQAVGTDKASIEIGVNATSSAGIFGKVESDATKILTLTNQGSIQVGATSSVGIYAQNETSDESKLLVNNAGIISVTKEDSVGINAGKRAAVTNSGTTANGAGIVLSAKKTAGIIGNNNSVVINEGDITLSSANQPTKAEEGLVGISLDSTSTAANDGTITVSTDYSTGISGKGKLITNNKKIILNNKNSVGIASTDGLVFNSDDSKNEIEVKESSSVGIYAKATGNIKELVPGLATTRIQNIVNAGTITLNGGNAKTSSVGIYSLIGDSAVVKNVSQNIISRGTINVGTKSSAGIYIKDERASGRPDSVVSRVSNTGDINITEEESAGIIGEYSQITNGTPVDTIGKIELSAKKTAGIIVHKKSEVINYGTIETSNSVVVNNKNEALVGISADNSTVINKNKEILTGMIGTITLNTAFSTGIYGKNSSTLTNEGKITTNKSDSIGMAGENSSLTNKNEILMNEEKSVGMFGTTDNSKNTVLINEFVDDPDISKRLTGKITTKKKESVGMFVSTSQASAINRGTILIEEEKSAGMYGDEANIENTGTSTNLVASIATKKDESAGMYAKNSNATNKKKITIEGKKSAGILVEMKQGLTPVLRNISGTNEIADNSSDIVNGLIEIKDKESAGMYGIVDNSVTEVNSTLTLLNKKTINIDSKSSVGMMLINNSTAITKEKVKAENTGTITLSSAIASDNKNIGILVSKKATGINNGAINVNTLESVGMLGQNASSIINNKTITLSGEKGVGMLAKDTDSVADNRNAINVNGKESSGMLAQDSGKVENNKNINVEAEKGVGIFVSDTGTGENVGADGKITLMNKNAVGIFAQNNGNTYTAKNSGTIILGKEDGTTVHESLIGMFVQAEAGKIASVKNDAAGIINVNTKKSVGMYAKNDAANNVTAADLHNTGIININNQGSAGIYAPKANISKVGTINLKNTADTDGSSAVYISEGGKVADTGSAVINLGTVNQNRVAYYVNGANSSLAGTNIGKITGYGVGVYLEGDASKTTIGVAKIGSTTPKLHYKNNVLNTSGNGIIGLFLSGDTEIKNYNDGIVVGDSIDTNTSSPKYAIGIYANAQGTSSSAYEISTPITAGKNGVGIYASKDSNIKYAGNMEIGDGTTAGIGIFITKKEGANGGKVELASNTIKLKGTGGVAVIASEGTEFDGKNATIELVGTDIQGVGVYAKKGSTVNINNWTFNNHGNAAEEVRSEEGGVYIDNDKLLRPKMVLTHVINGETAISSGKTVTSISDGKYNAEANIGLMAEGVKNPTAPSPLVWRNGNFEIENHGTIDFSVAEKSTAIFSNSARALNDGIIKVGKNSTAIYGFFDSATRKHDLAIGNPNKLEIKTTANSNISLGNGSTGMYLINAEKVETDGKITADAGAAKNVGIYVINGQDSNSNNNKSLIMTTAAEIALGDGSVGIYSKGQSNLVRNTVTNTGNITIGNQLTTAIGQFPAVAVYAENTKFDNNSKVKVGENGIAFYGKNSEITAKNSVDFLNKGVLAYLENSKFVSYLGDLNTKNTMVYAKDSDVTLLDSSGGKVKVTVADGVTGAYIEGDSTLNGVREIVLGEKSTGLFLKNTQPNFVSSAELISGAQKETRGIIAMDSNLTNNSKISLTGEESVGIYSNAGTFKTVVNNGQLTLSGKKTLGVFLRGAQSFKNIADIDIDDSSNPLEPTIGIYTAEGSSSIKHSSGTIEIGKKSIGIYSKIDSDVEIESGKIHVKDEAIGIYKEKGKVILKGELNIDKHASTAANTEPVGVYAVNGTEVNDQASQITIGEKSYGFILNNTDPSKTNIYRSAGAGTVTMGDDSVFLYLSGKADINNKRSINGNSANHLIGFYIKNGGNFVNEGNIDFSNGKGNIGIYAPGGKATNKAKIFVGKTDDVDPLTGKPYTDASRIVYGIGMAADNGGHIINDESGEIRIYGNKSIGMYGSGQGTVVENRGKIYLDGSRTTAADKVQSMTGVYIDDGATFVNRGIIRTADAYAGRDGKVNENVNGLVGVAIMNGSTLENYGDILIDAEDSYGLIIRGKRDSNGALERYAVIKNYGNIKVAGKGAFGISWKDVSQADIDALKAQIDSKLTSDPRGREIVQAAGTDKNYEGVSIAIKNGKPIFSIGGVQIPDSEVEKIEQIVGRESNVSMSDIGFYIDTLGRTKPVNFVGVAPPVNSQLIIGTEYSEITNKKQWFLTGDMIKPFLQEIQGRNFKLTTLAGSLTWIATPVLDNHGQLVGIAMKKIPYTSLVEKTENAYNFTDGLEQRYDMNHLTSLEKRLFVKLNDIGKNEEAVMTQAIDEMMGHQYANVQQRIFETGNLLNKEFGYLRNEWDTKSKNSNKIKVFGMKGEYKTDTAGIIDYRNKAYGFAYLNEIETIRLGESKGWYAGAVRNNFDFSDIGNSKEEQNIVKAGVFKSIPIGRDYNNGLNWTVSAEGFVGTGEMKRKFLVVDEIFQAKSEYRSYGFGLKNELRKNIRISERTSISPYGSLKFEYGRFDGIKENTGQMRLEIKSNDYYSIKPEIGVEFNYKQPMAVKTTFVAKLGLAYENELGKVGDVNNKGRVRYTTAGWFDIRGEKDDRRGNGKADLNLGIENTRFGVTVNAGYDTKGKNVRGGIGFRVIY